MKEWNANLILVRVKAITTLSESETNQRIWEQIHYAHDVVWCVLEIQLPLNLVHSNS